MRNHRKIKTLIKYPLFLICTYLFFSFVNWTFIVPNWGGVSIFIFSLVGVWILIEEFDEI